MRAIFLPTFLIFFLYTTQSSATIKYIPSPEAPTALSLHKTEDTDPHPTLRVEGLRPGDIVRIYLDEKCSHPAGFSITSESAVDVSIEEELPVGDHTFYAALWRKGFTSPCSEASASYRVLPEPPHELKISPRDEHGTEVTPTIVVFGVKEGDLVTLYRNARCSWKAGSSTAEGTSVEIVSKNLALGKHSFYAQTQRNQIISQCSSAHAHYKLSPSAPHTLSIPEGSRGSNSTPVVRIEGVKKGDIVKLYNDSACNRHVGTATAWGSRVAITVSHPLSPGHHRFHAQIHREGHNSSCSDARADYEIL